MGVTGAAATSCFKKMFLNLARVLHNIRCWTGKRIKILGQQCMPKIFRRANFGTRAIRSLAQH